MGGPRNRSRLLSTCIRFHFQVPFSVPTLVFSLNCSTTSASAGQSLEERDKNSETCHLLSVNNVFCWSVDLYNYPIRMSMFWKRREPFITLSTVRWASQSELARSRWGMILKWTTTGRLRQKAFSGRSCQLSGFVEALPFVLIRVSVYSRGWFHTRERGNLFANLERLGPFGAYWLVLSIEFLLLTGNMKCIRPFARSTFNNGDIWPWNRHPMLVDKSSDMRPMIMPIKELCAWDALPWDLVGRPLAVNSCSAACPPLALLIDAHLRDLLCISAPHTEDVLFSFQFRCLPQMTNPKGAH